MTPLKPMAWWGGSPFPVVDVIIKTEQSGPKKMKIILFCYHNSLYLL